MQYNSFLEIFDTQKFTTDRPVSPVGELFTYYPALTPEALHYHNFLEIGYCEAGRGDFIIDGGIVPFAGRCVSIIYEGQIHIAQSISPEKSLWHFLYIDLKHLFGGVDPMSLELAKSLNHHSYEFQNILSYEESPALYELVRLILQESAGARENYIPALRGLVYSLLIQHSRFMRRKASMPRSRQLRLLDEIGETINYINVHYMQEITVETLVEVSSTSKASLQRKFMAVTGMAPIQYLHHLRLNRAAVMLAGDDKPILEIAMAVGYNSLSSFNRLFLKTYGMSPSAWRKRNGAAGEDQPE